jgi:hypothetical protein
MAKHRPRKGEWLVAASFKLSKTDNLGKGKIFIMNNDIQHLHMPFKASIFNFCTRLCRIISSNDVVGTDARFTVHGAAFHHL